MKGPLIFMAHWKWATNQSKFVPNHSKSSCKAAILGEFCKSSRAIKIRTRNRFFSFHQQDHLYIITLQNRNVKIFLASYWTFVYSIIIQPEEPGFFRSLESSENFQSWKCHSIYHAVVFLWMYKKATILTFLQNKLAI